MAERRKAGSSPTRGTAPSAGDPSTPERIEPSEEAKSKTPSDVDARGQDKRRQVVGHSYGPSRRSQFLFFGAVVAIMIVAVGGFALAVAAFDQPPDEYPDEAPWSRADAEPIPTRDPSAPCGEPGNPYPPAKSSACGPGGIGGRADSAEPAPGDDAAGQPPSVGSE